MRFNLHNRKSIETIETLFLKTNTMVLSLLFVLAIWPYGSFAKTIQAVSGSRQDLQAAINSATKGDIVMIPAGRFLFDGEIRFDSGITIMGAGIDQTTIKSLELVVSSENVRKNSLLDLLDVTCTAMGARRMRDWVLKPLIKKGEIEARLSLVDCFKENPILRGSVR